MINALCPMTKNHTACYWALAIVHLPFFLVVASQSIWCQMPRKT